MLEAKPVKGLAPDLENVRPCYRISKDGILYGACGKPTNPRPDKDGYLVAGMSCWPQKRNKYIRLHKLVALAFIPDCLSKIESGLEIDHRDGNKQNNDISNLQLVTSSENKRNPNTRYNTRAMLNAIPTRIVHIVSGERLDFESAKDAAEYLHVSKSTIRKAQKRGWKVGKEWLVYEC